MGAFSDNAIGFVLQVQDTMERPLRNAARNYDKFTKALDKANTRSNRGAQAMLDGLGAAISAWDDLPAHAAKSYASAMKQLKPRKMSQPIEITFTAKGMANLARAVNVAVTQALAGGKLRLSAAIPTKRLAVFDTSVSLRRLYSEVPQPPDYTGSLSLPKFGKGGIVEGGQPGQDSVLALLMKGELVLPADVVDDLRDQVGGVLRDKTGRFMSTKNLVPPDVLDSLTTIINLSNAMEKLQPLVESGFGTPKDLKMYQRGLKDLNMVGKILDKQTKKLSDTTRHVLGESLKETAGLLNKWNETGKQTGATMENLLGKIITPVRFLALRQAVSDVTEAAARFGQIGDKVDAATGNQLTGFRENLLDIRAQLQLTRTEMIHFGGGVGEVGRAWGVMLDTSIQAANAITKTGLKDQEMILALQGPVSSLMQATHADGQVAADVAVRLASAYGYSTEQVTAFFNAQSAFAKNSFKSIDALMEESKSNLVTLTPLLNKMTKAQGQSVLENISHFSAAANSAWADSGDTFNQILSGALAGTDQDAIIRAQTLFGMRPEQLRSVFESGDLKPLMQNLSRVVSQANVPGGLSVLRDALHFTGTDAELANVAAKLGDVNNKLDELKPFVTTQESLATAIQHSKDENQLSLSVWDKVKNAMQGLLTGPIPGFNTSLLEMITFLKDLGPTGTIVAAVLATKLMPAIGALGGMLGGLLGKIPGLGKNGLGGWLTDKLGIGKGGEGGVGGIGAGVGKATESIMGGIGKGLKLMGEGMTVFGKAMLGPGGLGLIAATVAIIGIGFAAKLAAPAISAIGDALRGAGDGLGMVFAGMSHMDAGQMLAAGPGLVLMAGGLALLAPAVVLFGVSLALAAGGVWLFRKATGGDLSGPGGVAGIIGGLIDSFAGLGDRRDELARVNDALAMSRDFLINFGVIGAGLAVLGTGAIIAETVGCLLSFFGVSSPMEMLADQGGSMATTLLSLLTSFAPLGQVGPERIVALSATLAALVTFMQNYGALAASIDDLPGSGMWDQIADGIIEFFGADSPVERLSAEVGPLVQNVQKLLTSVQGMQLTAAVTGVYSGTEGSPASMSQILPTPIITPAQVDDIVAKVMVRADDGPVHKDLQETNRLLKMMLEKMGGEGATPAPAAAPATRTAADPFAARVSAFGY